MTRVEIANPTPQTPRLRGEHGFTLIELLVGILITAGICGATTVALTQALKAKATSEARRQAFVRATTAADRIALNLTNFVRDGDLYRARVLISDAGEGEQAADQLLVFTKSLQPTRPIGSQPEGDHYEVQYRIQADERAALDPKAGKPARGAGPAQTILWRRVDPVPDENPEGGGVAFPLAERIAALSIDAFDGKVWYPSWDSDRDGYPHAVRLTVWATSEDGTKKAAARRVVAFDRVPVPFVTATSQAKQGSTK